MDEIREILCKKFEYDVITISESWLSPDISVDSTDLHIDNYTFYRKDRFNANKRGGGVGVFVTNNLLCLQRAYLATNDIELLWLELHTNSKTVLVGVFATDPLVRVEMNKAIFFQNWKSQLKMLNLHAQTILFFWVISMINARIGICHIHKLKSEINY